MELTLRKVKREDLAALDRVMLVISDRAGDRAKVKELLKKIDGDPQKYLLVAEDAATGQILPDATSCSMCRRLIINAGIQRVVIRNTRTDYAVVHVEDWIREDDSLPQS